MADQEIYHRLSAAYSQEDQRRGKGNKGTEEKGHVWFARRPRGRRRGEEGVLYYEYDLMFHYLLASLRHADGKDSVTKAGTKLFDIFAGLGQHR